jgi:hypothetical protein
LGLKIKIDGAEGDRFIYDINRPGHSNQGHYFKFFETLTIDNKLDLIEYLKTL